MLLVVIATDDAVARWAQTPLESGHPGHVLAPIVISFRDIPKVDANTAIQLPELLVLSALARRSTDIVDFLNEAINQLPQNRGSVYLDLLYNVVPGLREEMMKRLKYEFQTEFARQYYGDGLEDGRKLGREEAREEFREALIEAARVKITNLTSDEESAIRRLSVERARSVMRALVTAGDSETARAALTEAIRSDQS